VAVDWRVGVALGVADGLGLASGDALALAAVRCGLALALAFAAVPSELALALAFAAVLSGLALAFGSALGLAQTAACRAGAGVLTSSLVAVALTPLVSTATSLLPPPKAAKATRDRSSNGTSTPMTIGNLRRTKVMDVLSVSSENVLSRRVR
jgi:hypothetical protein